VEHIGRYELVRVLGQGGMGVVYEAVRTGQDGVRVPVALKVLRERPELLREEGRLGSLLRHQHLVDVLEVGEDQGRWFCAFELCPGGSLSRYAPLPPRAVVDVGLAVCAALDYAHDALGLVHQDLKPDNLLLLDDVVKVGDLGIARADGFGRARRVEGTRGYMPPEQAAGRPVDARADLYALGVTLVELATGRPPHDTTTFSTHVDGGNPAWAVGPEVPGWLARAVTPCLAEDPEDRWPSARALADALRSLTPEGPGLRAALGLPPRAPASPGLGPEPDRFVGREVELVTLAAALDQPGLLVVAGPAGVGKSRVAAVAARRWSSAPGRSAWRCDGAAARSWDALSFAVTGALGVALSAGDLDRQARQLGYALAGRGPAVLLLDDVDGVEDVGGLVARWLVHAPELRVLITQRGTPPGAHPVLPLAPLAPDAAVELVVVRARQRGAEVAGDPALPQLVARLDHLPLALELAAGRLGVWSVSDALARVGASSWLRQATEGRHTTLRAAVAFSWDLLGPPERSVLAQLSVFSGGFDLAAARAVVDVEGADVVAVVARLVDRALVTRQGPERLRLMGGVRELAADQLGPPDAAHARHRRHYLSLPPARWPAEIDDLLLACRRAVARGEVDPAAAAVKAGWAVATLRGLTDELRQLTSEVLALPLSPADRLVVERIHGVMLQRDCRYPEAAAQLERAGALARSLGDRSGEAIALSNLASVFVDAGRLPEAHAAYVAALEGLRAAGERSFEASALGNLALLHFHQGAVDEAARCGEAALELHRHLGDRRGEAIILGNLADVRAEQGRFDEAGALYERALQMHRANQDRAFEGIVSGNLGDLRRTQGRMEEAARWYTAGLVASREVGNRRFEAVGVASLGDLARDLGQREEARGHYERAVALARDVGHRLLEGYAWVQLAGLVRGAGALRWLERAMELVRSVGARGRQAEALAVRAEIRWELGDESGALDSLREAEALGATGAEVAGAVARAKARLSAG
jgi:tetratricopeptide (TPR) repeat protein